jgi:hypothetical protein
MAWATKYRIEWKDIHDTLCRVDINYDGYSGAVISLLPSDVPFVINEDDDTDPFKPVRTQSGKIGIIIESQSDLGLLSSIIPSTWNSALVLAYRNSQLKWVGFVSPTAYTQPWVAPPFAVEIPVYDMVSALYYANIPTSMRIGNHIFGEIYETAIDTIFGSWANDYINTLIQTDFANDHHILEMQLPAPFYFEEVSSDSTEVDYSGISFGSALEKILPLFGMNIRSFGSTFYFNFLSEPTTADYIGNVTIYVSNLLSMQDIYFFVIGQYDIPFDSDYSDADIADGDVVRNNGSVTINKAYNAIRVRFPINLLQSVAYITMPDYDEENAIRVAHGNLRFLIFQNLAPNCQAFFYHQDMSVTVYQETDPQSPYYGEKIANITNTQSLGGTKNDLIQYLGQEPGFYPTIPTSPTSTPVVTRMTEGAIMCKYAQDSISEMKEGIFLSSEPYQSNTTSNSASILFTISTPESVRFTDGEIELSLGMFRFTNYPFSNSGQQYQEFVFEQDRNKLSVSLSIGNNQWTGLSGDSSASECWTVQNTPIIVYIDTNVDAIKIKIDSVPREGIVTLRIHNCIPYVGDQFTDPVHVKNTILFHLISSLNVSFIPTSSQYASSRNENLYYETSSLHGEDKEVVLSIGSDQDNKRASNILLDRDGNIVKTIEYTDGRTEHPEQHLARRMAQYYQAKQFVYEMTIDNTEIYPTDQITYYDNSRGVLRKESDWGEATERIVLIKQIQLEL